MKKQVIKLNIWMVFFCFFLTTPALAGTAQYTYDKLNRLTQVQYDDGATIQYSYDAAGNRLTQQVTASTPPPPAPAGGQTSGALNTPVIPNSSATSGGLLRSVP